MTSSYLTYQAGLARIDDLRLQAEAWRRVKLARAELGTSRSMTRHEQPLKLSRHPLSRAVDALSPRRAAGA
jgi:hypothetical protein